MIREGHFHFLRAETREDDESPPLSRSQQSKGCCVGPRLEYESINKWESFFFAHGQKICPDFVFYARHHLPAGAHLPDFWRGKNLNFNYHRPVFKNHDRIMVLRVLSMLLLF